MDAAAAAEGEAADAAEAVVDAAAVAEGEAADAAEAVVVAVDAGGTDLHCRLTIESGAGQLVPLSIFASTLTPDAAAARGSRA